MKPLIIGNWKCNPKTLEQAQQLFNSLRIPKKSKTKVVICPPFVYLKDLKGGIMLGAQDCFYEHGSHTGQISVPMLKSLGCKYAIVGHSEKRVLGETNKAINNKVRALIKNNLHPILCVGETKQQKSQVKNILEKQIKLGLRRISKKDFRKIIIAYEPVWAIGTGKACASEEAMVMQLLIRKILREIYCQETAKKATILYGGSVDSKNALDYVNKAGMQGLLIGSASLKAKEFIEILKKFC